MTTHSIYKNTAIYLFDLTIDGEQITNTVIQDYFTLIATRWWFQLERNEGSLRWKCRISTKTKKRLSTFTNDIFRSPLRAALISPTSKEYYRNNFYIMDESTRVDGPWRDSNLETSVNEEPPISEEPIISEETTISEERPVIEDSDSNEEIEYFHPWQQTIIDRVQMRASNMRVNCVVGSVNISSLGRWLSVRNLALTVKPPFPNVNTSRRYIYEHPDANAYLIEVPGRCTPNRLALLYCTADNLAKCRIFVTGEQSKRCLLSRIPHVWVFTHSLPDMTLGFPQKWKFWTIEADRLIAYQSSVPT